MSYLSNNPIVRFFSRKFPLYLLLLAVVALFFATRWKATETTASSAGTEQTAVTSSDRSTKLIMTRLHRFEYISPLLLSDPTDEDPALSDIKGKIASYIEQQKTAGLVADASVYLRKSKDGGWMEVNNAINYKPGSMGKIAVLITWLKMVEKNPALLSKKLVLEPGLYHPLKQFFPGKELEPGKPYMVKELFRYMICESANSATMLLGKYMDNKVFEELFTDLDLQAVKANSSDYDVTAKDISKFMRILYNASYLGPDLSQYALSLLCETNFAAGLKRDLPPGVRLAHKFGEAADNQYYQLHETGVFYANENTYMLTVMTRGKKPTEMAECIAHISGMVYPVMMGQ